MSRAKLEDRKAADIAYIEHVGPYDKIPWQDYIERLYAWAKSQKVMPGFHPMGVYLDDPKTTTPSMCRTRVTITFKGDGRAEGGVLVSRLPQMRVATLSHKGPASEIAASYARLAEFVAEKGLRVAGPPMEIYSKKPETIDGKVILYTKILMPVE